MHAIFELSDSSKMSVVRVLNWLTAQIDDLLINEWSLVATKNTFKK